MSAITMLRRRFQTKSRVPSPQRRQLAIDTLERRDCPTTAVMSPTGGILTVTGTDSGETIIVQQNGNSITAGGRTFTASTVNKIIVHGLGGADTIWNNTDKNSVLTGDSASDTIHGGNGTDQIYGGTNNDFLYGGNGNDDMYGEQGDDYMYGASGYDGYETGNTNDTLQGGDGADHMYGGYGADVMVGGNDNDWIQGQWGDDMIAGANWNFTTSRPSSYETATAMTLTTNDTLFGENGNDQIYGGEGNDDMSGGWDNDDMYGENGNDRMWGESWDSTSGRPNSPNNDTLWGGNGSDQLFGGDGIDHLVGGNDNDYMDGQNDNDILWGGNGIDPNETGNANDTLHGGSGSDWLYGGVGDDQIYGDADPDALEGDAGNDQMYGGTGNDNLVGSEGQDWLFGGDGEDTLWGAAYQDVYSFQDDGNYLFGEAGKDNLYGGNGYDYMDGGSGDDGLFGGGGYNILNGGTDDDRFLTGPGYDTAQGFTVAIDDVQDADARDAVLNFASGDENWTESQVTQVDVGLNWLHHVTNNTSLLQLKDGGELTFERDISLGDASTLADNNSAGRIRVADSGFTADIPVDQSVVHEVGHNWDTENDKWDDFTQLSGWSPYSTTEDVPDGYTRAVDLDGNPQPYVVYNTAEFAREYGRTSPQEDFATCLETYYSGNKPAYEWQSKWNFINDFIASKSD